MKIQNLQEQTLSLQNELIGLDKKVEDLDKGDATAGTDEENPGERVQSTTESPTDSDSSSSTTQLEQTNSKKRDLASISDLAPFVASVLRDTVVSDLQEENHQLRDDLGDFREHMIRCALAGFTATETLAVTGPNKKPVYSVVDECVDEVTNFHHPTHKTYSCCLGDLRQAELHVNGTHVCNFRNCIFEDVDWASFFVSGIPNGWHLSFSLESDEEDSVYKFDVDSVIDQFGINTHIEFGYADNHRRPEVEWE